MKHGSAYYNENDPYAAQWLRNLVSAGLIAPGIVDERSIAEVRAEDLRGFDAQQYHFFAGIGVWSYALRQAGWPDDRPVWTGSCPCQPFSAAGKRGGFDDARHLWPVWFDLIAKCRPINVFGEQVASRDGLSWFDAVSADLEGAGYAVGAVDTCAAGAGAPHIRQRLYFVADTNGGYASEERQQGGGEYRLQPQNGCTCGLANTDKQLSQQGSADTRGRNQGGIAQSRTGLGSGSCAHQLADATSQRREGRTGGGGDGARVVQGKPSKGSGTRVMGDADGIKRPEERTRADSLDEQRAQERRWAIEQPWTRTAGRNGGGDSAEGDDRSRSVDGFWHDAEWLPCTDGKARSIEPGTFPLAHGVAARVGRLRAYGNALCAPQAAEFVRAYLEVEKSAKW